MTDAGRGDAELATCAAFAIAEEVLGKTRHDLRNRLSSIQNASFYLKRKSRGTPLWNAEPRVESFFEIIEEEIRRAQALLTEEATVAGRWHRAVAATGLASCVERALRAVRIPEGVTVETSFADTTAVELEPTEVALLVKCLLENAVDAMADGGVLALRSFETPARVVLEIQDSGPGFGALEVEMALLPFVSTRPGRAGLGLCVARRSAAAAGAELRFRTPGAGTVVSVAFPIRQDSGRGA